MAQSSNFDPSTQWLFVASSKQALDQLYDCHFTAPARDVRSFDSLVEYFATKQASLEKERLQGAVTDLGIQEEKIRVPEASERVAKTIAKWLESRDVLREYIVATAEGTTLGWIFVRRGYCRTANTVRVIQYVSNHETSRILGDESVLFSTLDRAKRTFYRACATCSCIPCCGTCPIS
jgi:hypothetical protein